MKKSSIINLVLVSSIVITTSCNNKPKAQSQSKDRLYLRTDSSGSYSRMHSHGSFYPYYLFHSYGAWNPSTGYHRSGFSSNAIHSSSNGYTRSTSRGVSRGGFGHSSFHSSGS